MTKASSLREFMRGTVDARSACIHCDKPIERRVTIWYASGEGIGADICRKDPSGAGAHASITDPAARRRAKKKGGSSL
jgi:hypothetical protein